MVVKNTISVPKIKSNLLQDLPIAKKLMLFCLTTSFVTLAIVLSVIVYYDRQSFETILKDEMKVLASVISNRSSAAIVFEDQHLASSNLKTLDFQTAIVSACIYKLNHSEHSTTTITRIANYPEINALCPHYTPEQTLIVDNSDNGFIELIEPVILDNSIIGYLYIKSNTNDLESRKDNHFIMISFISIIATLAALLVANILSRWISGPLHALGKTARIIAKGDNYSHRAIQYSNDEVGDVVHSFNQMLDVIERENVKLSESEKKFRLISASSKVGIFQFNNTGDCIYANDELSIITGLSNEYILNNSWLSAIHQDDQKIIQKQWKKMLHDNEPMNINCRLNNNGIKWVNGHVALLKMTDTEINGYLGTINDISAVKNAQVQLEQMAFYDTLTGLANRRLFRNRLEHVINNLNREDYKLGLILLDLDNFKNVNDSLGHDAGDTLLIIIAEYLQKCVRASDTVARLGGDEFAIILPGIHNSQAVSNVAQKILATLKKPIILQETEFRITASAGISMAPEDSKNAEELIKNADLALYHAKDKGRDNYQFFTTEMNTQLIKHLQLIQDIRQAIDNKDFYLVYQPQIDLKTAGLTGFECLLRWQHKQHGFISPVDFIPVAEETGLIIPLGRWVILEACKQMHHMRYQKIIDDTVVFTINLSVQQFQDEELIEYIQRLLEDFNIKPGQLEIELTETVLIENLDHVLAKLETLKKSGILISIDDFGTGYSSLAYLKRLPVDILKVDRSFVMDIPDDKDDMEITAAVIAMAHNLNYKVVAEGVETEEQLQFLQSCNCDYGQGYFFSKPLPANELELFCLSYSKQEVLIQSL